MRVISGTARGRKLREPAGMNIRPTTDMVKESVFNIIQFDIEGRRVLDMFAGTGQLGIEALSRGAREAVFFDESAEAVKIVEENLKRTGFTSNARVLRADSVKSAASQGEFDIIFIDPPYDSGLLQTALDAIIQFDILKLNGIIMCETRAEYETPQVQAPYVLQREYKYRSIKLIKYGKVSAKSENESV